MITTTTGAKKLEGTDNWRQIIPAHNDSVDAYDSALATQNQAIETLNSNIANLIKLVEHTEQITIAANSTKSQRIDYDIPSGYSVIGVTPSIVSGDVIDVNINMFGNNNATVRITSHHSTQLERNLTLKVICKRN